MPEKNDNNRKSELSSLVKHSSGPSNMEFSFGVPQNNKHKPICTWGCIKEETVRWQNIPNGIIIILTLIIMCFLEYGIIPSSQMGFTCGDPLISHEYNGETITPEILGVIMGLMPVVVLLSSELLRHGSFKNMDLYLIAFYFKEILVGSAFTMMLTEVGKAIIAEHRPHFFDVCEPDTAKNCSVGTWIKHFQCTTTKYYGYFVVDSSRSFPSGHSSISSFVGLYCSHLVQNRFSSRQLGILMKPFLVSACLTLTLLCSLTRITDRRHHWWDVLAGIFLGLTVALYFIFIGQKKIAKQYRNLQEPDSINLKTVNQI